MKFICNKLIITKNRIIKWLLNVVGLVFYMNMVELICVIRNVQVFVTILYHSDLWVVKTTWNLCSLSCFRRLLVSLEWSQGNFWAWNIFNDFKTLSLVFSTSWFYFSIWPRINWYIFPLNWSLKACGVCDRSSFRFDCFSVTQLSVASFHLSNIFVFVVILNFDFILCSEILPKLSKSWINSTKNRWQQLHLITKISFDFVFIWINHQDLFVGNKKT
jgi:hypothetical protein